MNSSPPRIVALFGSRALFGAERANADALRALQQTGAEVLCLVREDPWPELFRMREFLDQLGLQYRLCPFPDYPGLNRWLFKVLRKWPGDFLRANRILERTCREFEATHIHCYNPFLGSIFAPALAKTGLPLVYRCGDVPTTHNGFYRAIWRWISRRTVRFVVDSKFIAEAVAATGVSRNKIEVIYAPAPTRIGVKPYEGEVGADGFFDIVYLGQIIKEKGVAEAVEAMRLIRGRTTTHVRLFIVGPVDNDFARALQESAAADLPQVTFLGAVEDVIGLLRRARIHLAPSTKLEPYGLVVVEAKLAGIPSIIFDSGGMSELVEDGSTGRKLIEHSAEALASAILEYANDPQLASIHGGAAQESLNTLGHATFAERWRAVYDQTALAVAETNK